MSCTRRLRPGDLTDHYYFAAVSSDGVIYTVEDGKPVIANTLNAHGHWMLDTDKNHVKRLKNYLSPCTARRLDMASKGWLV